MSRPATRCTSSRATRGVDVRGGARRGQVVHLARDDDLRLRRCRARALASVILSFSMRDRQLHVHVERGIVAGLQDERAHVDLAGVAGIERGCRRGARAGSGRWR